MNHLARVAHSPSVTHRAQSGPAAATTARPWKRALAWLAVLAPFFYLSYGLANYLAAQRASVPSIVFDWERHVPFIDWTIFPYWSVNVFYGLSLLLARNRHELDRHGARLLTAQCIAVLCFIAWPLHFSFGQPEVHGAPALLFDALRGFDLPYNQAPSLHIALAVILWDLYRRLIHGQLARLVLHGWTLAICLSVLTTWQHHFIDIPTGALLGLLCVWAWPLERRVAMPRVWRLATDERRRTLALRYVAGSLACVGLGLAPGAAGSARLWLLWPAVSLLLVALNYLGMGARGFQMDRHGRMAWAARALLAPYLLAAQINGRLWTRGLPAVHPVQPGLSLVSLSRMNEVGHTSKLTLVSLCAEMQVPADTRCLCLPWLDLVPATPVALRRAATLIDAAVRRGDPVFIGCALGFSRSVAALACWMTCSGQSRTADEALARLRLAHPRMVLGDEWLAALKLATAQP